MTCPYHPGPFLLKARLFRSALAGLLVFGLSACGGGGGGPIPGSGNSGAVGFTVNAANDLGTGILNYDYGRQLQLPAGFGQGDFTLEIWIKPDASFPIDLTTDGTAGQRTNWSSEAFEPTDGTDWWFRGNFLLDGHTNNSALGTFSLQLYGGGRVRWHFTDSAGVWILQVPEVAGVPDAPSILDGNWHHLGLVRRCSNATTGQLELWVDGSLLVTQATACDDMQNYWDSWTGYPSGQEGWFWGAEKQAAIGSLAQYEDYKGLLGELRFWSRARSSTELSNDFAKELAGNEAGLVGWFLFGEGAGPQACDTLGSDCIDLIRLASGAWTTEGPPRSP